MIRKITVLTSAILFLATIINAKGGWVNNRINVNIEFTTLQTTIDDVEVFEISPCSTIPYLETFDGSTTFPFGWSSDTLWSVNTIWPGISPISGNHARVTDNMLGNGTLYSPCFDVSTNSNLNVRFYNYWAGAVIGSNSGYFYGSPDGGTTAYLIDQWHYTTSSEEEWKEYDISSWADGSGDLKFWWESDCTGFLLWGGSWAFDNFEVTGDGLGTGLVAYYPFSGNANDESGNGNHGTVNGATLTTDRFGNANSAFSFDGNDYIEVIDDPDLNFGNGAFSFVTWINYTGSTSYQYPSILYKYDENGRKSLQVDDHPSAPAEPFIYSTVEDNEDHLSIHSDDFGVILNENDWTSVVSIYDGAGTISIYINGMFVGSETNTDIDNTDSNSNLYIGTKSLTEYFWYGEIDDIRIYNRALTEEEILTLYHEGMNTLSLITFLEGPYNGTEMSTDLNPNPIPLSQPYNDPLKWDYQGTENVISIPNADVVDWVLVELRETSGDASTALPDSMIARQAAFILKDGSIVGLDGTSPLYFDYEITDNLYVVVYHRNHLPIMSSAPLTAAKGDYTWDFTMAMDQAYGTDAQVDLGGGVFGMIGGDGDSDGLVKVHDIDTVWSYEAGNSGYLFGDFSLDKQTDNKDKNDIWNLNDLHISQVPGYICTPQPDYANAGPDQFNMCEWDDIYLSANIPVNGVGTWTIESGGGGYFDDIHDPNTFFYGGAFGEMYKLKWSIINECGENYDFVIITYDDNSTQADAGPDQYNVFGTSTTLEANTPDIGNGAWSIHSGEGGSFEDMFDPNTTFYGIADQTYGLKWEISMVCIPSEDYVTISFSEPFICGNPFIDNRDGQTYNSAQIGPQCWMSENLNIGTFIISGASNQTNNDTIEKWCYDDDPTYCNSKGGLYRWDEIMQYAIIEGTQGICPKGFHVPTDEEWKQLEGFADSLYSYPDPEWENSGWRGYDAGTNLKSTSGWYPGNFGPGTNLFGFNAIPCGSYPFFSILGDVHYSTSSVINTSHISRRLNFNKAQIERNLSPGGVYSLRCLNDEIFNQYPELPSNPSPQNGSTDITIDTLLSWSCSDPEGEALTYNIYLGLSANPPLIQINQTDTFYYPGTLLFDTTYYWKIVAYDIPGDSTVGNVWSFNTIAANQAPIQPSNPSPQNGAGIISNDTILSWSCSDPDGEGLSYNIYFGVEENPPLFLINHTDTFCNTGTLLNDTTYYWKISAYDTPGDSTVGNIWSFSTYEQGSWYCGVPYIDDRDGQSYNTVQIGTQCWMAQNLDVGDRIDGENDQTDNSIIEKYCYNDIEDSCDVYGGLYQWNEMMDYITTQGVQGICPEGWHVPTDEEWKQLEGSVDSQFEYPDPEWNIEGERGYDAGLNLKSVNGWNNEGNGSNFYGFNALPSGSRAAEGGVFYGTSLYTNFWTSSESNLNIKWDRGLNYNSNGINRADHWRDEGFNVRCLQVVPYINQPPNQPANPTPIDGSTIISVDTILSWSCSDPDSDDLTYNIYFGTEINPPLIQVNHADTFYNPGTLLIDTTYYWKIVAYDTPGDSTVGEVWSFSTMAQTTWSCGNPLIDNRDGQSYNTVQIGNQCWMAENLNIGTMLMISSPQTNNDTIEKYCYDNIITNCDTYGGLYLWDEVMEYSITPGVQGICLTGWHMPTQDEYTTLTNFLGGTSIAGGSMKEVGYDHWNSPNTGATNSSGFTGFPGGLSTYSETFANNGNYGYWWSSTEDYPDYDAWRCSLRYNLSSVGESGIYKGYGLSVRCINDDSYINQTPAQPSNPSPQNGSTIISVDTILSWSCSDPDSDDLTYNIYFGTEINPPLIQVNHADTFYNPGTLLIDTTYYWKIVAYDTPGDSTVGEVWSFSTMAQTTWSCGNPLIDSRDGQSYNTVQIGTQCWMAENLNIGIRIDGGDNQTDNLIIEKYCYNDIEDSCDVYGGLYQWDELMEYTNIEGVQGICPVGWYLPTDEEWKQLLGEVDSQFAFPDPEWDGTGYRGYDAGLNLKSTTGWYSNGNGLDLYNFHVTPGGRLSIILKGYFEGILLNNSYWSSSESSVDNKWKISMAYNRNDVYRNDVYKYAGYSVRCLKD